MRAWSRPLLCAGIGEAGPVSALWTGMLGAPF